MLIHARLKGVLSIPILNDINPELHRNILAGAMVNTHFSLFFCQRYAHSKRYDGGKGYVGE